MKNELLIKILEKLDEIGPNEISIKTLIKMLGKPNLKELYQIILYLDAKKRVHIFDDEPGIHGLNLKNKVSITAEGVDFLEREKREIYLMKIQEQQLDIQRQQTKTSEKQTLFTELLAIGTIVLALGTFLSFFNISFNLENWLNGSFISKAVSLIVIAVVVVMFAIIVVLVCKSIKYLLGNRVK